MSEAVSTKGSRKGGKAIHAKKGKKESAQRREPMRKEKRAGLIFPVARIGRYLRKGLYSKRISVAASIYLTAVMEYVSAEVLELAGNAARAGKHKRITPRDVMIAVEGDEEFHKFVHGVIIPDAGVIPHVHAALLHTGDARREYFQAHRNAPFNGVGGLSSKDAEAETASIPRKGGKRKQSKKSKEITTEKEEDVEREFDEMVTELAASDKKKQEQLEHEIRDQEEALAAKKNALMRMRSPGTPETVNVSDYSSTVDVGKEMDTAEEETTGESDHPPEKAL